MQGKVYVYEIKHFVFLSYLFVATGLYRLLSKTIIVLWLEINSIYSNNSL